MLYHVLKVYEEELFINIGKAPLEEALWIVWQKLRGSYYQVLCHMEKAHSMWRTPKVKVTFGVF
ncbi:hypothetical protein ACJQWY_06580, partial [Weissella kandleri]|uniref:hypothetical protein n=1 Tax=Weissella kandleri TaxID=1616 RepID=UPI00387E4D5F